MEAVNQGRIWIGALVGWVVWVAWTFLIHTAILAEPYATAQAGGGLFQEPRYPYFLLVWIVALFVLSYVLARLYAALRRVWGAGRGTALKLGLLVGFAAGFPISFTVSTWVPVDRIIPFWWMLDLWIGSMIAAYLAGWLYREKT